MDPDATKAAARKVYETLNHAVTGGDLEALGSVIAQDAVDHNPIPGQRPGLVEIQRAFREFAAAFSEVTFRIEDILAEGEKAAVRVTVTAVHTGPFLGAPPTGRRVTETGIDILRFSDGKLVERWGQFDELGLLRQLDLLPQGAVPQ